jgi:hypothetical protein
LTVLEDCRPLLVLLDEVGDFGFGGAAALGAVGHELDAGGLANCADTDSDVTRDEPTAFLALAVFIFGVDGEDSVLAKPVAADDGDFFDVASVAEEFAAVGGVGVGQVY